MRQTGYWWVYEYSCHIETHLLPQFFNTIQRYLFIERIQDQFLNDCTSEHMLPIVSYKGF